MTDAEQRVTIATEAARCRHIYHTEDDCDRLTQSATRSVERSKLTDEWQECACCDGTAESVGPNKPRQCPRCEQTWRNLANHLRTCNVVPSDD